MRNKKAKKLRKDLQYDMKKERIEGRRYFSLLHKEQKNSNGEPLNCGTVCDNPRRLYQALKRVI